MGCPFCEVARLCDCIKSSNMTIGDKTTSFHKGSLVQARLPLRADDCFCTCGSIRKLDLAASKAEFSFPR